MCVLCARVSVLEVATGKREGDSGNVEKRRGQRAALVDATGAFLSYPTMSASLKLGDRGLSLSRSYFRERALTTLRDVFQATEDTYLQSEALFSKA